MIISGGFNIYPSEVEQVLWKHPAVLDCAVIGVPDEKWGEAVKAIVELKSGVKVSDQELREHSPGRAGELSRRRRQWKSGTACHAVHSAKY